MQDKMLDGWRYKHAIPDHPMLITQLSKYRMYDPSKANLKSGDVIRLVRRAENLDDPNAIEVYKADQNLMIGYIPREISQILAPMIDSGAEVYARFHAETDVASGMVVVHGPELDACFAEVEAVSQMPTMDTSVHMKRRTEDLMIEWYNDNSESYDRNANRCNPKNDMNSFISKLPAGAKILDAGCGNGRDIQRFRELGFDAHGFDASSEMCRLTAERMQGEVEPRQIKLSEFNDPQDSWDGIWAMASLVHTEADALADVVAKLKFSLKPEGVLFAALKFGAENEIAPDGRRVVRVTEEMIREAFLGGGEPYICAREARNSSGQIDSWVNVMFVKAPEPEFEPQMET